MLADHIWLREDYSNMITNKGIRETIGDELKPYVNYYTVDRKLKAVHLRYSLSNFKDFIPLGWKVPSEADFKNIEKMYEANKLSNLGNDMRGYCRENEQCGLLGFNADASFGAYDYIFYFTSTGEPMVYVSKDASSLSYHTGGDVAFLRLIQE